LAAADSRITVVVMKTTTIVCASIAVAAVARADDPAGARITPKSSSEAIHLNAQDLKWADAPPDLPKGAQLAVLHGDPFKPGPYAMRLKAPDGYKIPPHWHTRDEELTIISGTLALHMGDSMKTEPHVLDVAGYHFLPGKMHHGAEMRGETIVQIQGIGPFDIHYLNAADNPNPKAATR
jgi:hypothetical protein